MRYGLNESFKNCIALIRTKMFYRGCRLIRFPLYIRNKKSVAFGSGLTTGYFCRFDIGIEKGSLTLGKDIRFGDRVHVVAMKKVEIGDDCLFASNIFVSDCDHGEYTNERNDILVHPKDRELKCLPVKIGPDCWIGENVCILKGSKIGRNSIIGANSVVNGEIPEFSIAVGQPAKVIKRYNTESGKWEKV